MKTEPTTEAQQKCKKPRIMRRGMACCSVRRCGAPNGSMPSPEQKGLEVENILMTYTTPHLVVDVHMGIVHICIYIYTHGLSTRGVGVRVESDRKGWAT